MKRTPKCQICPSDEAVWAMQFVGEDTPTFSALGWHYRGFPVIEICCACKDKQEKMFATSQENVE